MIGQPARSQYALARASLEAGKHTFVEQPLAPEALIRLVEDVACRRMCGHAFLYSPPVGAVADMLRAGTIGASRFARTR